ncbi:tyrosine-type recombinase/integrase [Streptacidiphilus neutrinimicus]|uniref:tyrosine-type recombinase/integrase n=1 Tax=Streptacidiphilus neutrinimicus TaxID=105420 RepID=UPI0005AAD94A|nr:site-specific integrase [Streptacidiphilus neutrinimicus]
MANVYDRWHKSRASKGDQQCPEHKGKVASSEHGVGKRWQVRYRDPAGEQRKENFERKADAERRAAELQSSLDVGTYVDPAAAKVTLGSYAQQWLASNTAGPTTGLRYEGVVRNHIEARLGHHELRALNQPSLIRAWIKELQEVPLAASTILGVGDVLAAILDAAVDDGRMPRNPCKAKTVKWPTTPKKPVVPWTRERVAAVIEGLPDRFQAGGKVGIGCGLRQGEIFALADDSIDFKGGWIHVNAQIRFVGKTMVFALPKGQKIRSVPMSRGLALALKAHMKAFPPVEVTLPWDEAEGDPRTLRLLFVDPKGNAYNRSVFNQGDWKRALVHAGVIPPRTTGSQYFQAAPEDGMHALRHTYASAQLEGGTNIKALAVYLGHSDPGFTLRTYTHLMPSSEGRSRDAADAFLLGTAGATSPTGETQGTADLASEAVCPQCALAA